MSLEYKNLIKRFVKAHVSSKLNESFEYFRKL